MMMKIFRMSEMLKAHLKTLAVLIGGVLGIALLVVFPQLVLVVGVFVLAVVILTYFWNISSIKVIKMTPISFGVKLKAHITALIASFVFFGIWIWASTVSHEAISSFIVAVIVTALIAGFLAIYNMLVRFFGRLVLRKINNLTIDKYQETYYK